MDHTKAIEVFKEIQARRYGVSPSSDVPSNNCFYKGSELLQRLAIMGYAVRGRVAETSWRNGPVPKEIVDLLPDDILVTHFFTEVLIDDQWCIVDPSFQTSLESYGFTIGSWENGKSCFPITKLYSQEESLAYQEQWFNLGYQKDFFDRGGACWEALNKWFQEIG